MTEEPTTALVADDPDVEIAEHLPGLSTDMHAALLTAVRAKARPDDATADTFMAARYRRLQTVASPRMGAGGNPPAERVLGLDFRRHFGEAAAAVWEIWDQLPAETRAALTSMSPEQAQAAVRRRAPARDG